MDGPGTSAAAVVTDQRAHLKAFPPATQRSHTAQHLIMGRAATVRLEFVSLLARGSLSTGLYLTWPSTKKADVCLRQAPEAVE